MLELSLSVSSEFQELLNELPCVSEATYSSSVNNYTTLSLFALPKGGANIISHHWAHFLTQFSYAMYL